jgi:hypothetical protein
MFRYQARMKAEFLATMSANDVNVTVVTSDSAADDDAELA